MRVGELRKALEGVADDVPVVGLCGDIRFSTKHAYCVSNHTDTDVGAFAIEIAVSFPLITGMDVGKTPAFSGVDRQQRQAEADIKREASNPSRCRCSWPMHSGDFKCEKCGGKL